MNNTHSESIYLMNNTTASNVTEATAFFFFVSNVGIL